MGAACKTVCAEGDFFATILQRSFARTAPIFRPSPPPVRARTACSRLRVGSVPSAVLNGTPFPARNGSQHAAQRRSAGNGYAALCRFRAAPAQNEKATMRMITASWPSEQSIGKEFLDGDIFQYRCARFL